MLNLRQLSDVDGEPVGRLRTIPTLRISVDVAGNMGEPLEFGGDHEGDLDAEEGSSGHDQNLADNRCAPAPTLGRDVSATNMSQAYCVAQTVSPMVAPSTV